MDKRVMILGAGCTGRGHVGELAYSTGWDLILVDKNPALIAALREAGRYTVSLFQANSRRDVTVDRLSAYHVDEADAIVREALHIPLILTALFSQNLREIAPLVARIIAARCDADIAAPLNVIGCENMQDSSTVLRAFVAPLLASEDWTRAASRVGFPNCMVSRVVPLPTDDPLILLAEDYNEWTVDAAGFVGSPVDLPAMELVTNQQARLARKFFMHNGGHAICGYWGFHRGHTYIHEAVADPFVLERVLGAIEELAAVVSRRWGLDLESVRQYGLDLGRRGAVAELKDLILRVVRDPLRKLSGEERLVAPAVLALEYGLPCAEIVRGIAAALHYHHPDDPQSIEMQAMLLDDGPEVALPDILGLPAQHPLLPLALSAYQSWTPPAL